MHGDGMMNLVNFVIEVKGNVTFSDNTGTFFVYNSYVNFTGNTSFVGNRCLIGGAITTFQSEINFYGTCSLMHNVAGVGGAVHATESKVYVYGETTMKQP